MTEDEMAKMVNFLKALADASRLRLLGLLAEGEHGVDELASMLGLKAPTVSHHLRRLRELGLVRVRPDGTARWYSLDQGALHALAKALARPETIVTRAADEPYEDRVLRAYVVDGRLKEIPALRKKRAVVLEWLVRRFERGREYTEKEVSASIAEVHEDFATLRRELVMARLLSREEGRYARTDRERAYDPAAR